MSKVHTAVLFVIMMLEPMFWRKLLTGRTRVCVYLEGGQKVKVNLSKGHFTLGKETAKYEVEGMLQDFAFRPTAVIAWREVRWF